MSRRSPPAARRPGTCPGKGGHPWLELKTSQFVLHTDAPEDEARAAIAEFERIEQVFIELTPGAPIPGALEVILVKIPEEELEGSRYRAVGLFRARMHDVVATPMIVLLDPRDEMRTTVQHELTHRFVHEQIANPPIWLDEGLADYLSTMRVSDGKLEIGRAARSRDPRRDPISVARLLTIDRSAFYRSGPNSYFTA